MASYISGGVSSLCFGVESAKVAELSAETAADALGGVDGDAGLGLADGGASDPHA